MTANINTIIYKVNNSCDKSEFVEARKLIEYNLKKLSESKYYRQLNSNGQALIKLNIQDSEKGEERLTRLDLLQINEINKYAYDFDISMLKRTITKVLPLLQREDVQELLSNDAKYLLESMGAILIGKGIINKETVKV